ncbi:hypothetical protein VM1G_00519 [Cytospora mali]|uniref:Uncharacterized protein n=1 Tax=Cytospora mali TaxID=578113 RepID=A0A194VLH2_CYTMA|nr:hypothetical protein VM1G_00519 [Valsa mali]
MFGVSSGSDILGLGILGFGCTPLRGHETALGALRLDKSGVGLGMLGVIEALGSFRVAGTRDTIALSGTQRARSVTPSGSHRTMARDRSVATTASANASSVVVAEATSSTTSWGGRTAATTASWHHVVGWEKSYRDRGRAGHQARESQVDG